MEKKVLIVIECIAPVNSIASIRFTKIGKYLAKNHDCIVDVLTNRKDFDWSREDAEHYRHDETLAKDLKWFNKVYEIPESFMSGLANRVYNYLKKRGAGYQPEEMPSKSGSAKQRQEPKGLHAFLWNLFIHFRDASKIRKAFRSGVDFESYDVVISTYGPMWPHQITKRAKVKYPQANFTWIADFRDSPIHGEYDRTDESVAFVSEAIESADYSISVSQGILKNMSYSESDINLVIANGYDPDELNGRERSISEKFLVTYTGSIYDDYACNRDLRPVLRALNDLILEKQIDRSDALFVYCGADGDKFYGQAEAYREVPTDNRGLVSRADVIALQGQSSLLVLATWNTEGSQGIVTGKVFEYFCSGVPIACTCSGNVPNSVSKEMIQKSNTGFCYEEATSEADYPALKQFILGKYKEWKETGLTECESDWEYIQTFGHDKLAQKFYDLF